MKEATMMTEEEKVKYLLSCSRTELSNLRAIVWPPADVVWMLLEEIRRLRGEVELCLQERKSIKNGKKASRSEQEPTKKQF
jgi:hypothetical protein